MAIFFELLYLPQWFCVRVSIPFITVIIMFNFIFGGQLVKLASEKLNWKKSTTYTVLRKLCENGIFKNEDTVVSAVISQEEYVCRKGEVYLEEHYNGSLPKFVAAFMNKKKLKRSEIEELAKMKFYGKNEKICRKV